MHVFIIISFKYDIIFTNRSSPFSWQKYCKLRHFDAIEIKYISFLSESINFQPKEFTVLMAEIFVILKI